MTLRFDEPLWLLAGLIAVPAAAAGLVWFSSMGRARRWSAVAARVLLVTLVVGCLAGASLVRTTDRVAVVAVVDVSGSVRRFFDPGRGADGRPLRFDDAVRVFLEAAGKNRRPDDLMGMVVFDGRAIAIMPPARGRPPAGPLDFTIREGTDIAQAIALAAGMIPPDAAGRLVLFSDGVETTGNAVRAARELVGPSGGRGRARRIPIDVVPLAYSVRDEVIVEAVDSPPVAPSGATVTVRVVLVATRAAAGTLQLLREGEPIDINGDEPGNGRRVSLAAGRTVERIAVPLRQGRVHRFEAVFEPDTAEAGARSVAPERAGSPLGDTVAVNNRAESFTITPGKGSVLVIDGVSDGDASGLGATLPGTLAAGGIEVQTVAPGSVRPDLLWLQGFDLVILQNVAAEALPESVHRALVTYVTELGGGLVMVGGPDSFGAGGWKGTDLEPILPVRLDLPDKLVVPAAAVVIVIDSSGSMNARVMGSARTQQEIANDGAALAIETLDKTDLAGVIAFDSEPRVVVPLRQNSDQKGAARRVRGIAADGGTNLPPALELAALQLRNATADVKHVIVLSDGRSQSAETLPGIAERLAADGIKISSIAVGDGADAESLAQIARLGGGRFYRVTDPALLPRIFVKAVRIVRTPLIREQPFRPVLLPTASPLTEGLGEPPPLGGLVLTQPRPDATVVHAMAAPGGEPLLAHWNAGIGRVAAFTSDAHRWASPWLDWPGYSRLWTQTARAIARPPTDRSQELTAEIIGDRLALRLDAVDAEGRPLDLLSVRGSVYAPDGARTEVRLGQTGPGQYEATVPAASGGNYVVTLAPRAGASALPPVIGGASRAAGAEYRHLQSNVALLKRLAEATGGRVYSLEPGAAVAGGGESPGADLFRREALEPARWRSPLWRTLLYWTVVVMLLDVGTRRVAWDRLLSREFGRSLRREAAEAFRSRGDQAAQSVGRLRERDEAVEGALGAGTVERLSEDDAREIVRAQAERRRAARAAGRASAGAGAAQRPVETTGAGTVRTPSGDGSETDLGAAKNPDETSSSLFEAKRRARQRLAGDEEAPP